MRQAEQLRRFAHFGFRSDAHVNADRKTGEPRGADALHGQFRCARPEAAGLATERAKLKTNGQKKPRHRLKLMHAAAEKSAIGFEENKMTAVRDGANQMRNAGMMQRFASPDPNDRRAAGNNFTDLFVGNRMAGIGMQNIRRIYELDQAAALREKQFLREPGLDAVRGQPQGEA